MIAEVSAKGDLLVCDTPHCYVLGVQTDDLMRGLTIR